LGLTAKEKKALKKLSRENIHFYYDLDIIDIKETGTSDVSREKINWQDWDCLNRICNMCCPHR
jgi:hypothetical protein